MAFLDDLGGRRFGRLVVVRQRGHSKGHAKWLCECDCGNRTVVFGFKLKRGMTASCGCLRREVTATRNKERTIHGMSHTPNGSVYRIWSGIKTRCFNQKDKAFRNYGGRGIQMCVRWAASFVAFRDDMGPRPSGYTVERVDNDGHYEPGNCVWIPRAKQAENRRANRVIEYRGKRQHISAWAREVGISPNTMLARLKRGWPLIQVMNPRLNAWRSA
jgi:hypothetical protein